MFLVSLAFAFVLSGCPSASPTVASIDKVELSGDPTIDDFSLRITGRGFGPTIIRYDLSSGAGMATTDLKLEIFDPSDQIRIQVPTDLSTLSVPSPEEIVARVVGNRLNPGIYGVRLYPSSGAQVIAMAPPGAFTVVRTQGNEPDAGDDNPDADNTTDDSGTPPDDAGVSDDTGGGTTDGTTSNDDALPGSDAQDIDAGPPDSGIPPDSGLGPFVGGYRYRRLVNATNATLLAAPVGTTIALTIPLQTMVQLGQAKADGSDVALYLGPTLLDTQYEDASMLATNNAVLIARMPVAVSPGPIPEATPLILYFGDPLATVVRTDAVFTFVERFAANVQAPPWKDNMWARCDKSYPLEATLPGLGAAYCVGDSTDNPTKRTLATPVVTGLSNNPGANLTYEALFYIEGLMQNQTNDLLLFAYGDSTQNVQTTILPAPMTYLENPPLQTLTFDDGAPVGIRTLNGWRFPAAAATTWTRTRTRFVPTINQPTLHFRYISNDGVPNLLTYVAVDDLSVRLALQPDWNVTLGSLEAR